MAEAQPDRIPSAPARRSDISIDESRLMLQPLLADRAKLKLRSEKKELAVLRIERREERIKAQGRRASGTRRSVGNVRQGWRAY